MHKHCNVSWGYWSYIGGHCFFLYPSTSHPPLTPVSSGPSPSEWDWQYGSPPASPPCMPAASSCCKEKKQAEFTLRRKMWYCIAGKFQGRRLLWISQFCGYPRKFSLQNLGACCPLARHEGSICKSFLCKNRFFFFANSLKFSPSKVSNYTVVPLVAHLWCVPNIISSLACGRNFMSWSPPSNTKHIIV